MNNKILTILMVICLSIIIIEGIFVSYHFSLLNDKVMLAMLAVTVFICAMIGLFIIYPIMSNKEDEIKQLKYKYAQKILSEAANEDQIKKLQNRLNEYRLLLDIKTFDDNSFKGSLILAKFIGKDGSAGYEYNKYYKLLKDGNIIRRGDNTGIVKYDSNQAFLRNWQPVNKKINNI